PGQAERDAARQLFQETFGAEYEQARTNAERLALAQRLFEKRLDVQGDSPSLYVLLDIVRRIAMQAGHVSLALRADDELNRRFDLADVDLTGDTLRGLAKTVSDVSGHKAMVKAVDSVAERLYYAEQYEASVEMLALGIGSSRRANDAASFQSLQ